MELGWIFIVIVYATCCVDCCVICCMFFAVIFRYMFKYIYVSWKLVILDGI